MMVVPLFNDYSMQVGAPARRQFMIVACTGSWIFILLLLLRHFLKAIILLPAGIPVAAVSPNL